MTSLGSHQFLRLQCATLTAKPPSSRQSLPLLNSHAVIFRGVRSSAETSEKVCFSSGRRDFLFLSGLGASLLTSSGSSAEVISEDTTLVEDLKDRFSLVVPASWERGDGKAGINKVVAFYPPGNSNAANVNLVISYLGADYTSLGSFGNVDAFAERLVNGLDRSWKRPPGQAVKLVKASGSKKMYYVEYTIQKVGEPQKHLISAVGIHDNGTYNRLFTLTGQFWESDASKYYKDINNAIQSFKLTAES